MIYRPSKPDIDLIGDFINPNKKSLVPNSPSWSGGLGTSGSGSGGLPMPTITSPSKSPGGGGRRKSSVPAWPSNNPTTCQPQSSSPPAGTNPDNQLLGNSNRASPGTPQSGSSGGCRKVRLRIQKGPGGKENKFVELQNVRNYFYMYVYVHIYIQASLSHFHSTFSFCNSAHP